MATTLLNTTILKIVLFVNCLLFAFLYAMYNEWGRKTLFGGRFPGTLLEALGYNKSLNFMDLLNDDDTPTIQSATTSAPKTTFNYKNYIFEGM